MLGHPYLLFFGGGHLTRFPFPFSKNLPTPPGLPKPRALYFVFVLMTARCVERTKNDDQKVIFYLSFLFFSSARPFSPSLYVCTSLCASVRVYMCVCGARSIRYLYYKQTVP